MPLESLGSISGRLEASLSLVLTAVCQVFGEVGEIAELQLPKKDLAALRSLCATPFGSGRAHVEAKKGPPMPSSHLDLDPKGSCATCMG